VSAPTGAADPRLRGFVSERWPKGDVEVRPLSGDASTRRYFRLGRGGESFVLSLYPEPFLERAFPFLEVRALLERLGLPVPAVLAVDGPRGIVLQQDLGDVTLQQHLVEADGEERARRYREAVDQLVALQQGWGRLPTEAECFRIAFDEDKLSWELGFFVDHFVCGYRGCRLPGQDRAELDGAIAGLAREIASWPRVLCHRDYHSRNLLLHGGRLHWIDFQDARMGPVTYDLSSLLRDAYVDIPEALVDELVEDARRRVVPDEPASGFARRFELTSVQRNLKALGTFGYQAVVRDNPVYVPYMARTLSHARRNLERHPELAGLREALGRHLPELR
jgi:aminoglycoside/choline kinase family phosphotransferase